MTEITFFEIHLHDASFVANAPFSAVDSPEDVDEEATSGFLPGLGGDEGEADEAGDENGDEDDDVFAGEGESGGSSPVPVLLGVGLLVLGVLAFRRLLGGEPEPVPE